jgi:hypothetical protein
MVGETIFQNWIVTKFALPFLLIFFLVFAILEKTKILGDNKQINALIAFVVGLIFVGFASPKEFVENMILFLTVALVVLFVVLILWGFVSSGKEGFELEDWMKYSLWGIASVAVIAAVLWSTGIHNGVIDLLFYQNWSGTFWTNVLFIVAVAGALALVLKSKSSD